jgi:hypothetical protein
VSVAAGLGVVLAAFVALLSGVVVLAFRERRLGRTIAADDHVAQHASDMRILAVVFPSIIGGMLLTLVTAWLVFT